MCRELIGSLTSLPYRLFKFPQMDFEMAVWEMTHLLIAPKKVFKSIYYHKREPLWCSLLWPGMTDKGFRDTKHMASTGSVVHLPAVLLPPAHFICMVPGLHACVFIGGQASLDVCHCPFLSGITISFDGGILRGGPFTWTGNRRLAWSKASTRTIWTTGRHKRRRGSRVRILLRCFDTSLLPSLCFALHRSVYPDAGHQP